MFRRSDPEHCAGRALAALYREHATPTYRFALHFTGSQADAEDLLQTAFLEAHLLLLRGGELMNPRAWLASVVRTRALNMRRDRHDIPVGDDIDTARGSSDPVEASDELRRVRAMLWSLPSAQHQAFVLRHWSGLSNREIADVLGTTEAAVESLLVRARRSLVASEGLAPECVQFRTSLADGLPETPAMRRHRHACRGCATAGQRLAGAAAVAGALLLAPRAGVAHALAATIPGFTASAATTTATGVGTATVTKAALTKTAVTILALGTTAAALHTGRIHLANIVHALRLEHAAEVRQAADPPLSASGFTMSQRLGATTAPLDSRHPSSPHTQGDVDATSHPRSPGPTDTSDPQTDTDTSAAAGGDQNAQGTSQQDGSSGGNQGDSNQSSGGGQAAQDGNSNGSGSTGGSGNAGNSGGSGDSSSSTDSTDQGTGGGSGNAQ